MTRSGKIARLPREIREELNRRMAAAERGGALLRWLNGLPAMQAILAREFGGKPVSKQNLFKWRASGFAEWQSRRELLEQGRGPADGAPPPDDGTEGQWTGHLATLMAVRYATALAGWNGEADEPFRRNLRTLRALCHDVVHLRRGGHNVARLKLEQERREFVREKIGEEGAGLVQRWMQSAFMGDEFRLNGALPEERPQPSPAGFSGSCQPRSTQVNPGQP